MYYIKEERLEIGRQIYDREISQQDAAKKYNVGPRTIYRWKEEYKAENGLVGRYRCKFDTPNIQPVYKKDESVRSGPKSLIEYESMTKEELIQELVLSKISEARAKKGYMVKGVGSEKEYIPIDSKNTK